MLDNLLKIRLQSLQKDLEIMIKDMEKKYEVLEVSDHYQNRNSKFARVYISVSDTSPIVGDVNR